MHDIVIILVMTFPMFLFSIYSEIVASNYLNEKYNIGESKKRSVIAGVMFVFALVLSLYIGEMV